MISSAINWKVGTILKKKLVPPIVFRWDNPKWPGSLRENSFNLVLKLIYLCPCMTNQNATSVIGNIIAKI